MVTFPTKNIDGLLKAKPESYLASRNLILKSAVEGSSDTRTMPVRKVMAVDHLQSVAKHNSIRPIMFRFNCTQHNGGG